MNVKHLVIFTISLLLVPTNSFSGLFGPDTYEDCVLGKLKGQEQTRLVMSLARNACLKKIPQEKLLIFNTDYKEDDLDISWAI